VSNMARQPSITLGQSAMRYFATTPKPGGDRAKLKRDLDDIRRIVSVFRRHPAYRHPRRNMPHDAAQRLHERLNVVARCRSRPLVPRQPCVFTLAELARPGAGSTLSPEIV
jgi:hypothetical protein